MIGASEQDSTIQEALAENCFPKLSQHLSVLSMRDFGWIRCPPDTLEIVWGWLLGKTYITYVRVEFYMESDVLSSSGGG
jgi:hypothetical protein